MNTEQEVTASSFKPQNVGRVVVVQTFKLYNDNTIDAGSMIKYVGYLESYILQKNGVTFKLVGQEAQYRNTEANLVEVYLYN